MKTLAFAMFLLLSSSAQAIDMYEFTKKTLEPFCNGLPNHPMCKPPRPVDEAYPRAQYVKPHAPDYSQAPVRRTPKTEYLSGPAGEPLGYMETDRYGKTQVYAPNGRWVGTVGGK